MKADDKLLFALEQGRRDWRNGIRPAPEFCANKHERDFYFAGYRNEAKKVT